MIRQTRLLCFCNRPQCLERIKVQGLGELEKLNHVDPSLPAFETCDKGLIFTELRGEIRLRQALGLTFFNEKRDQRLLSFRAQRFRHVITPSLDKTGLPIYLFFSYLKFR